MNAWFGNPSRRPTIRTSTAPLPLPPTLQTAIDKIKRCALARPNENTVLAIRTYKGYVEHDLKETTEAVRSELGFDDLHATPFDTAANSKLLRLLGLGDDYQFKTSSLAKKQLPNVGKAWKTFEDNETLAEITSQQQEVLSDENLQQTVKKIIKQRQALFRAVSTLEQQLAQTFEVIKLCVHLEQANGNPADATGTLLDPASLGLGNTKAYIAPFAGHHPDGRLLFHVSPVSAQLEKSRQVNAMGFSVQVQLPKLPLDRDTPATTLNTLTTTVPYQKNWHTRLPGYKQTGLSALVRTAHELGWDSVRLSGTFSTHNRQLELEVKKATKLANQLGMPVTFDGQLLGQLYQQCDPADQLIQTHLQRVDRHGDRQINSDDTSAFLALTALAQAWGEICSRDPAADLSAVAAKIQSYAKHHTRNSPTRQRVWLSALMRSCAEENTKENTQRHFSADSLRDPHASSNWYYPNPKKLLEAAQQKYKLPRNVTEETLPPVCAIDWSALGGNSQMTQLSTVEPAHPALDTIANNAGKSLSTGLSYRERAHQLVSMIGGQAINQQAQAANHPAETSVSRLLQQINLQDHLQDLANPDNDPQLPTPEQRSCAEQWAIRAHICHQQVSQDNTLSHANRQKQLAILDVVAWQLRCIAEPENKAHANCVLPLPPLNIKAAQQKLRAQIPDDTASAQRGEPGARPGPGT